MIKKYNIEIIWFGLFILIWVLVAASSKIQTSDMAIQVGISVNTPLVLGFSLYDIVQVTSVAVSIFFSIMIIYIVVWSITRGSCI